MCGPKAYVFSAVLVIKRVYILAILFTIRVWFLHSSVEMGRCGFIIIDKTINKSPSQMSTAI